MVLYTNDMIRSARGIILVVTGDLRMMDIYALLIGCVMLIEEDQTIFQEK